MGTGKWALGVALVVLACAAPLAHADTVAGVVPDQPAGTHAPRAATAVAGASLDYSNGPVMHSNRTHVIFWNPSNSLTWDPGYKAAVIAFLQNVAADSHKPTNVYALSGQYTDTLGGRATYDSTYAGSIDDGNAAPTTGNCSLPPAPPTSTGPTLPNGTLWPICLTAAQLRNEVVNVVTANSLPIGLNDIYFVVTPDGFGSCDQLGPNNCSLGGFGNPSGTVTGSYCGFHTFHAMSGTDLLWAHIPYNHVATHCRTGSPTPNGTADESISSISHEHNETITDPLLNAWVNGDRSENGDLCATTFGAPLGGSSGATAYNEVIGTGHYFIQAEWSNEDANGSSDPGVGCKAADENDALSFTPPASALPGASVALAGSATDPDGSVTSYSWDFGDGSPSASGASANHTFARTGVYQVTLTTTNVAGLLQSLAHPLTVDRPPTAAFSASAHPVAAVAVKFNGTASSDSDGSVASYRWSFGDGSTATGPTATNTFPAPGKYTVKLTVTDNLGRSSSTSHTLTVAPFPSVKPKFRSGVLRITVNGPGTLILGGKRTVVRKAGTVKIAVPLTAAQRRTLHRKHVLKLKLRITFRPRVGPAVTSRISVTLHG